jgi:hypothetical protein
MSKKNQNQTIMWVAAAAAVYFLFLRPKQANAQTTLPWVNDAPYNDIPVVNPTQNPTTTPPPGATTMPDNTSTIYPNLPFESTGPVRGNAQITGYERNTNHFLMY